MPDVHNSPLEAPRRRIRQLRDAVGMYKRLFTISATLLDLSYAAAREIGMIRSGATRVRMHVLK